MEDIVDLGRGLGETAGRNRWANPLDETARVDGGDDIAEEVEKDESARGGGGRASGRIVAIVTIICNLTEI